MTRREEKYVKKYCLKWAKVLAALCIEADCVNLDELLSYLEVTAENWIEDV